MVDVIGTGGSPATPTPCVAIPTPNTPRSPPRSARDSRSDATWSADRSIRQSWEDVAAIIAGARTGKTTTQVAPAILAAPGAVYTCSNKRDVVDLTAGSRGKNAAVWIFDPQGIADGHPTWWWNPLDMAGDLAGARTSGRTLRRGQPATRGTT